MTTTSKKSVAFIGTGIMGSAMAARLLAAGFPLTVYNRTPQKCAPLVEAGAKLAASANEAAAAADVVVTMVGLPEDVEELYLSRGGLVDSAKEGAYLVDMTTSSVELARDIADYAAVSGRHAFDAPVTGGQAGAVDGTLIAFCGAEEKDVEPVRDVLEAMCGQIVCFGAAGKGQLAKLANQAALAGVMVGLSEAMSLGQQGGLDLAKLLGAISGGMAGSTAATVLGPKAVEGDYKPGFKVEHFVKDLGLVLMSAEELEVTLPGVESANQLYGILNEIGGAQMGTQALPLVYADEASCAAAGLDWSILAEDEDDEDFEGADHGCGCGHDHAHGHAHGEDCGCGCDDCDCDDCDDCGCGHDHGHLRAHGEGCDCDECRGRDDYEGYEDDEEAGFGFEDEEAFGEFLAGGREDDYSLN